MVKKTVHIKLDENILIRLKAIAHGEGRTVSDLIRESVVDLLDQRRSKKMEQLERPVTIEDARPSLDKAKLYLETVLPQFHFSFIQGGPGWKVIIMPASGVDEPMQPSQNELEQAIENASEYADIYLELD